MGTRAHGANGEEKGEELGNLDLIFMGHRKKQRREDAHPIRQAFP